MNTPDILSNQEYLKIEKEAKYKTDAMKKARELEINNKEKAEALLEIFLVCHNKKDTEHLSASFYNTEDSLLKELKKLEDLGKNTEAKKREIQSFRRDRDKMYDALYRVPYAKRQTHLDELEIKR